MGLSIKIALFVAAALFVLMIAGRYYFSVYPRPTQIGTGTMAPCPDSPNCVSSKAEKENQKVDPIPIDRGPIEMLDTLEKAITSMPKSTVVTRTDNYLHVEFRSSFWNFIDDVEFFADTENQVIDVRSSARVGYSDGGVNRARYRRILRSLNSQ